MELQLIQSKIFEARGHRIMLDLHLAELYRVKTKVLKQAVKRNRFRFPPDFMFELTREEYNSIRSQIVTLEKGKGKYSKYNPFVFTEQGVAMLSSILKSKKAIEVNISIMRAFVLIRQYYMNFKELKLHIEKLEKETNKHFKDIYEAIHYLLKKDKQVTAQKERKRIGYKADK